MGGLSLADALAFCLLLAEVDPPRFDGAIAGWHTRFVLDADGITADEAAPALSAAKALRDHKTRDVGRLAQAHGLAAVTGSFEARGAFERGHSGGRSGLRGTGSYAARVRV
jgi:hypothetical protein